MCAAYSAIDHNVVDGAGSGGAGINLSASGNGAATLANNAVVNCAVGVRAGSSGPALTVKGYNLYHNNASDFVNWTAGPGDVAADPLFVDEAGHDYRLRADSPGGGGGPAGESGHRGCISGRRRCPVRRRMWGCRHDSVAEERKRGGAAGGVRADGGCGGPGHAEGGAVAGRADGQGGRVGLRRHFGKLRGGGWRDVSDQPGDGGTWTRSARPC